jgi:HK97 family phage major capsid protein
MAALTIDEHAAELSALRARVQEIDTEYAGQALPDEVRDEWNGAWENINAKVTLIEELRARQDVLRSAAADPTAHEAGASFHTRSTRASENIWDLASVRSQSRTVEEESRMLTDNAIRAVDQMHFPHEQANREHCQAHIERLMNKFSEHKGDRQSFARHILATGSPTYRRAFGKVVTGNIMGLTQDEQRAMALANASGGYAVPVTLDPTIIPTSNGVVNPWRAISRVEQITGSNTWNGVSAGAVVASRDAEFEEVSDDSPTLAQPTATVTKADVFIPFSLEIGQDWGSFESEMATLIQDAKDTEEATAFATGAGTGVNPQGVLTGATATVAAGTAAFTVAHAYALLEALAPRFRPNAVFVANLVQYNRIRQLDTGGGASIWVQNLTQGIGNDASGNIGATFLGRPAYESSVMSSVLTATAKLMIFGDFRRYFLIVDRIGLTVEVVPHIFGATNQRPIGSRGMFAYWRNTSRVLSTAAFKTLVTT